MSNVSDLPVVTLPEENTFLYSKEIERFVEGRIVGENAVPFK